MPRTKKTLPGLPSRVKGQRSLDIPFLHRFFPQWQQPKWETTEFWRWTVRNIPLAIDCREVLISYITSLEWKIEPIESSDRDELKSEITYYTKLFDNGGRPGLAGWDFIKLIESILQDYLDTPFGAGVETIREGDKAEGKIRQIIYMDSATLFPTLKDQYPVAQRIAENPIGLVVFPAHAVNRLYISPRAEIKYEGWGMAPPEKIFLALDQIRKGDIYLAKFLVDTPEAGILDLMNMDQTAATDWIQAFQDLYTGIDPFKIPVLYEHDMAAKWIPFTRPPAEIMFGETYHQYLTLVTAAYGLSPTDIGFASKGGGGGETLGGSIRDERKTRRSGVARTKKSLKYFFDRMLPDTLQFLWIDTDDEVSVAQSRARLANATASSQYIEKRIFSPKEMRLQTIADGLITIAVPEDVPEDEFPEELDPKPPNERPGMLGKPIAPSSGGHGEASALSTFSTFVEKYIDVENIRLRKLARSVLPSIVTEVNSVFRDLEVSEYDWWVSWHNQALWGDLDDIPELTLATIGSSKDIIAGIIKSEGWLNLDRPDVTEFVNSQIGIFRNIREDFYVTQSQKAYEFGEIDEFKSFVEPSSDIEKKFKSQLRGVLRDFWKEIPEFFAKNVIAGARNSLIRTGKLQLLDKSDYVDDNNYIIPAIRRELSENKDILSQEFDNRMMMLINNLLEEENKDD